ncbi:uncharacterized protein LOC110985629 [Acanthaster planci]|uniref:Uncharacterized protein LOC110985629 n=1 Tax=Acanthaster planci TaxID=133434 RepID=A0A8B7Z9X7_ACAPL|nr:uncharacterized protein LOC110985629 [Acanthaster planci]
MALCTHFTNGMTVMAKSSSVLLLIIQSAFLDVIILKLDESVPEQSLYMWPVVDSIVALSWISAMVVSYLYFSRPPELEVRGWKQVLRVVMRELSFAYIYWLVYSAVLVAKIQRLFEFRRELIAPHPTRTLHPSSTPHPPCPICSATTFKIVLSLAGIMFPLLAYSRDEVGHTEKYKSLLRHLGTSASLDILDSVMVLDILFTVYDNHSLEPAMENAINTFSSLCLLLPIVPLLALRIASSVIESRNSKLFDLALVTNSILYLVLVNLPLLCIRLVLWARRDIDISTFLIKNLMGIIKGVIDIYQEIKMIRAWTSDQGAVNTTPRDNPVTEMPLGDKRLLINDDVDYQFI